MALPHLPKPHCFSCCSMTNQRLMAQYGFVLPHGNPADRLAFASLSGAADTPPPDTSLSRTAAAAAGAAGIAPAATRASSNSGSAPVLLSLDRLQACLGDGQTMAAAFSGRDPYLYAALKVLPASSRSVQPMHSCKAPASSVALPLHMSFLPMRYCCAPPTLYLVNKVKFAL